MGDQEFDLSGFEVGIAAVDAARARAIGAFRGPVVTTLDAAARLAADHGAGAGRAVIGIGGCPASGKTTAAQRIVERLNAGRRPDAAVHLPMDGFHMANAVLDARNLAGIKGDIATYEVRAYAALLHRFKAGPREPLTAPDYDRGIHDVVADAIPIPAGADVLVTEGIYVGYPGQGREGQGWEGEGLEGAGWEGVRAALDRLFYLDTAPAECAQRIIARNIRAGRSPDVIRHKLHNDLGFMARSIRILEHAHAVIRLA
jgi:pantothenate kinase